MPAAMPRVGAGACARVTDADAKKELAAVTIIPPLLLLLLLVLPLPLSQPLLLLLRSY